MSNQSMQDKVLVADVDQAAVAPLNNPVHEVAGGAAVDTGGYPAVTSLHPAPLAHADGHTQLGAAALVAAAVAAAAEQAEALAALKKLSKDEALRMFETQNPARRDSATEQIVEHGIELQTTHGTRFAAAYLEEHKVPLDVGKRVLLTPAKRRSVRLKR